MISISKQLPVYFTVMTCHGVVIADSVSQLVKLIEKELDIDIYDHSMEEALDEFDTKIEDVESVVRQLKDKLELLKKKEKDKS